MTCFFRPRRPARWAPPLLTVTLVFAPLCALAAEPQPIPISTRPSLAVQAGQVAASMPVSELRSEAAQAQSTPASTVDRSKWEFFKSPVGIALLGTFAVGIGYAIYSTQNDRVNSPGKQ